MILLIIPLTFRFASPQDTKRQEGIEELIRQWKSDDAVVRDRAIERILSRSKEWTQKDLDRLADAREDRDPEVASRAKEAHARIRIRRRLTEKLVLHVIGIDRALSKGDAEGRLTALREAGRLWRDGELADADLKGLVELAGEERWKLDPKALLRATDAAAPYAPLVLVHLGGEKWQTRCGAVAVIGRMGRRELALKVLPLLKDDKGIVRMAAAVALGNMSAWEHADEIFPLLKDKDSIVRNGAVGALGAMRISAHADRILPLLEDKVESVRFMAARALEYMSAREHADRIVPLLKEENPWARRHALSALAQIGNKHHVEIVFPLLRDEDSGVRGSAATALVRLLARGLNNSEEKHWAEQLQALEKDANREVRLAASVVLVSLGRKSRAEQKDVLQRTRTSSGDCRSALIEALSRAHEPEAYQKLLLEFKIRRSIYFARDLKRTLEGVGLKVRWEKLSLVRNVIRAGVQTTPLHLIETKVNSKQFVLEGTTLRLMGPEEAMEYWREVLKEN